MPAILGSLPLLDIGRSMDGRPVAASREWFGDGMRSFSQIAWRRDLAEFIVETSPKDFAVSVL